MPLIKQEKKSKNGTAIWLERCTCQRVVRHFSNFYFILEEYKCQYAGGFGRQIRHRSESSILNYRSTVVCKTCLGRARVDWDPKERGLSVLLWSEYVALKAKKEPT